jgi:hypothetical protein
MAARYSRFVDHHGNRGVKRGEGRYINNFGYVLLRVPDHPQAHKGYVREHRWVMEQKLGRRLLKSENVHHINHIKTDNRPENLVILSRREHGAEHGRPIGVPVTAEHRAVLSARTTQVWAERRAGLRPMPRATPGA